MKIFRKFFLSLAPCALCIGIGFAAAETYPSKPVRIVVPYPPGGGNDIVVRAIGPKLSERLGQPVVIDNRGGATGIIGTETVAHSAPDGYTLLSHTNAGLVILPHVNPRLPYDPVRDFIPITLAASQPYVLVVYPKLPVTSVAQLIALAKSRPGTLNYSTSGKGSSTHMASVLFCRMAGVDMVHVPYKGSGAAVADLIAGQVQVRFSSIPPSLPHVKSGRLRALAVSSAKRFSLLPELPAVAETVPGFEVDSWYGFLAPARTPAPIVQKLHAEIAAALKDSEVKARLEANGAEAVGSSSERFGEVIRAELKRWGPVVRETGGELQ